MTVTPKCQGLLEISIESSDYRKLYSINRFACGAGASGSTAPDHIDLVITFPMARIANIYTLVAWSTY